MEFTPFRLNLFLFFKLPAAFWCGVRIKEITAGQCVSTVRYRWVNQNPFQSMYFAVQAMAAEITTGALVMMKIKNSGCKISMLIVKNEMEFFKKATGRITFVCNEGQLVDEVIRKAIETGEGQTLWLKSIGEDENGNRVSEMNFEWAIKVKS